MNTVYYMVGVTDNNNPSTSIGGHGYTYDPNVEGKKKVVKNVPTEYGYFAEHEYQENSVMVDNYINGRTINYADIQLSFLVHLESILLFHKERGGGKLLLITNTPKLLKAFIDDVADNNNDYHKKVHALYLEMKKDIVISFTLYPKGGNGVKHAHNQLNLANLLSDIIPEPQCKLDLLNEKEFNEPNIEFNKLVTASRWYFNTGDNSDFYDKIDGDKRAYFFGRVEPHKQFYGKATPDVYYSALFTKSPINVLDKLYDFCKLIKDNPLNHLLAGNLSNITSKEVAKTIDTLPGKFDGDQLLSPMRIAACDTPCLVEVLNPPGLAYRIKNKIDELKITYNFFLNRKDDKYRNTHFIDITHYFFINENKKIKFSPEFTLNTLKLAIPIISPKCIKPVTINLSIKYDCPDRISFAYLLKEKITNIKVYLILDFSNDSGVSYSTLTHTDEFDYLHTNSVGNLRVYNLKELGRQ